MNYGFTDFESIRPTAIIKLFLPNFPPRISLFLSSIDGLSEKEGHGEFRASSFDIV